jgi:hypothetical protein
MIISKIIAAYSEMYAEHNVEKMENLLMLQQPVDDIEVLLRFKRVKNN